MRRSIRLLATLGLIASFASGSITLAQTELDQVLDKSIGLLNDGHPIEAVAYLQKATMQFPQSASIRFQLGNGYLDSRNYQAAVAAYKEALKLQPKYPAAVLNIAYAYLNAGQLDLAQPWFNRFFRENPNAPNIPEVKAQILTAQATKSAKDKRYFDAKKLMEQAVQLNPTSHLMHFKLARACDELGDTPRAINEYETCLKLKPDYSQATFNIAGCYQSMGRTSDASAWLKRYLAQQPNAPDRTTVENMIAKLQEKGIQNNADPHGVDYIESVVENGKLYRWPMGHFPLKVFVDNGAAVPNFKSAYRDEFLEALSAWSLASQSKVTFMIVPDSGSADITCAWTANPYEVRPSGTDVEQGICLTQAFANKRAGGKSLIAKADLRICIIDRETSKPLSDDDMKKTCLHELGHALGLRGHSSNNHDIMFFSVSPTVWPVLSKRDKATLLRLYEAYSPQTAAAAP
jgi:tetratricopeptide (TPR) repeat protein